MFAPPIREARVITNRTATRAAEVDSDGSPDIAAYFRVSSLDWLPRQGLDLDAGIRLRTPAQRADPRPYPHVIGALSGFLPQFDIWRMLGKRSDVTPGPYVGSADPKDFAGTAAPGVNGYLPDWYPQLIKQY